MSNAARGCKSTLKGASDSTDCGYAYDQCPWAYMERYARRACASKVFGLPRSPVEEKQRQKCDREVQAIKEGLHGERSKG